MDKNTKVVSIEGRRRSDRYIADIEILRRMSSEALKIHNDTSRSAIVLKISEELKRMSFSSSQLR